MEKNPFTFSGLEEILRNAIRLSKFTTKEIAEKVGMSQSGLYSFMSGKNHISVENGDKIIAFLSENSLAAMRFALDVYFS